MAIKIVIVNLKVLLRKSIHILISIFPDVKENIPLELPQILVTKEQALEVSSLSNPYAKAKAMAAYEIAKRAAAINSQGCFRVTEWQQYTALVASGHELVRDAARIADEAREIDKAGDQVKRTPHYPNGIVGRKVRLIEKPSKVNRET